MFKKLNDRLDRTLSVQQNANAQMMHAINKAGQSMGSAPSTYSLAGGGGGGATSPYSGYGYQAGQPPFPGAVWNAQNQVWYHPNQLLGAAHTSYAGVAQQPFYGTGPFQGLETAVQAYRDEVITGAPASPPSSKEMVLYAALEQLRQVVNTLASQLSREVSAAGTREAAAAIREQEAASIKAFIANSHPDVLKDYYAFTQIRDKLTSK